MDGLRNFRRRSTLAFDAALPGDAMADFARQTAARLCVNARARLRLRGVTPGTLARLDAQAAYLAAESGALPPAMEWLTGNIRWVEAASRVCAAAPSPLLPALDDEPRLMMLMRALVTHSDAHVDVERLMRSMSAFDEVQGLSMAELWLAPRALRMALIEGFLAVGEQVAFDQRERLAAERWVARGATLAALPRGAGSAFYERALKLMHDEETGDKRRALEEWLENRVGESLVVIRRAHERQAMNRLLLENLMGSLRSLDALNWDDCFEQLSCADRRLREDTIYPRMDKTSCARVRDQVTHLSRKSGLSEWTVAHHAVRAAQEQDADQDAARATACWWLCDDEGRRALMDRLGMPNERPARVVPDPEGRIYLPVLALAALALFALMMRCAGGWGYAPFLAILAWRFAHEVLGAIITRALSPRPLLKLTLTSVPDELRTLVAVPVLLSSAARARELVDQLEALGVLADDPNLDFLLLGDFRDSDRQREDEDEAILQAAREGIRALNARAGRAKYHYLHRERMYVHRDGRFMGHERKRGALTALNELLLGGESEFEAEESCAPHLKNRFRYVITLDADTRVLPGAFLKMIGAIAHPLNRSRVENGNRRGYALLSPRVEPSVRGRFARLFAGPGGVDSYPTSVSSLYQDLCGRGVFGGKGIYELKPFAAALAGKLPDGAILSHDLIEGALAGAGFLADVTVHDGFPGTLSGYLKRLNRWTRGDWQLMPFIFSDLPLSPLARFMMLDNLDRSLSRAAALMLLLLGLMLGCAPALLLGLLEPLLALLLSLPSAGEQAFWRVAGRLAILPVEAYTQLDAVARALHRTYKSKKNMLEWTPAADAERQPAGRADVPGRVLAILAAPACLRPGWSTAALGLALIFFAGAGWLRLLEHEDTPRLSGGQLEALRDLAARTWRFFEVYVPMSGSGLPPDNVQLDPPVGVARRTSPTNIGLYLLSCLAAKELQLIGGDEMEARMAQTVKTVESMDKWRGQLYNWYDLDSLRPLPPRYVSTVDGGNLAACMMLCASAVGGELAARMDALARAMDFSSLYDEAGKLFYIGVDIEHDKVSDARYDLLASEARILSFIAIALKQAPVEHWFRLGRARTGRALISWSGTLFEYLMPELFLRAGEGSLLEDSNRAVVRLQRAAHDNGWGVSESGFFAFDLMMNYQYRAFGLSALSLRGGGDERVIAPYASMLSLPVDPDAACRNLEVMAARGWLAEHGLYEAVDFNPARLPAGADHAVVKSHMAHHQGMILAAVANALTGDKLVKHFARIPEARALRLLLEERSAPPERRQARAHRSLDVAARRVPQRATRAGRPDAAIPDGHLLHGAGATCWIDARGGGFYMVRGVLANRFSDGLLEDRDGLFVHVSVDGQWVNLGARVQFGEGEVQRAGSLGEVSCLLVTTVSPEDGALRQQLELKNAGTYARAIEVTGCFAVALCPQGDLRAHPAFQHLFIKSEQIAPGALLFTRNARDGRAHPSLLYAIDAPPGAQLSFETDLNRLTGRAGGPDRAELLPRALSGALGYTLNPCAALRARFSLAPGDRRTLTLLTCVSDTPQEIEAALERVAGDSAARARVLAGTQARAMLDFLSIDAQTHHLLQRASAFLFYPQLKLYEATEEKLSLAALWALGISGDLPIIATFIGSKEQMGLAQSAARAHEFYRAMGVWCDLILINDYGNDYLQPVRDQLQALIDTCHLRELHGQPGGARLLEGQSLTGAQRALIRKAGALVLDGNSGSMAAQLKRLLSVPARAAARHEPMRAFFHPPETKLLHFNGWGGFLPGGRGYQVELKPGHPTPTAWCNPLANPRFGAIVSERGGGFCWAHNSRLSRISPFAGDPLREGFSQALQLFEPATGRAADLLPVAPPARATHLQGASRFESGAEGLNWTLTQFVDGELNVLCTLIRLENRSDRARKLTLSASARFLMGAGAEEARLTEVAQEHDMLIARGAMEGAAFLALPGAQADDGALKLTLDIGAREAREEALLLGHCASIEGCTALRNRFLEAGARARLDQTLSAWDALLSRAALRTPDAMVNDMVNRFLPYQTLASRLYARAGLYQAGGAYGFRDQLQDMLCLLPIEPGRVRDHLLLCASKQFESGDVMHWWHPPSLGVRTRISDDLLFLPYVTACYVRETGDRSVLDEVIPYLADLPLPEDEDDVYAPAQTSDRSDSLRIHCIRAIERAARLGPHGLPLIGSGDWNDGMNRVGGSDAGESVWLGEFLSVVARDFADWCALPEEQEGLLTLGERMKRAVEESGWDGRWYRRAYHRDGQIMGSGAGDAGGCRIDLIAQGWAVAAGLDEARTAQAMDEAWRRLVDERAGVIKLLTPPFSGEHINPGYIAAYPPGVRENGGQYTHGACWGVMGWAGLGQANRAWKAFRMLLPVSHASTAEQAQKYRVEPYAVAADVYGEPPHLGRGGWTWYTGAAAWLCRLAFTHLMGLDKRAQRARLNALLPEEWDEAAIELTVGGSRYRLTARRSAQSVTLDGAPVGGEFIDLIDDGQAHEAVFPCRKSRD